MKKILVTALCFSLLFNACKKNDMRCDYDACANKAPDSEIATLQTYLTNNAITATQHCSGVFYRISAEGSGKSADACSNITVKYKGMLTNGTVFDQTGNSTASFNLGMLVPAWRNVLPLIKGGGKMTMYVPPSLGYGSSGSGAIPPNAILIFDVEMVSVQ